MPITSVVAQASATSTGSTITAPADIVAGDLLVLWDVSSNGSGAAAADVVPTGFTRISADTLTVNFMRGVLSYKISDGSEASATITGMDGTASDQKQLYVFRGNVPITDHVVSTPNQQATTGNPAAQTVVASAGVAPLVVLGSYGSSGAVDPRNFTVAAVEAKDGEINASTLAYLAYKIYNTSPADVVVDMADEGSNLLASCYIEVQADPVSRPVFHRPARYFSRRF